MPTVVKGAPVASCIPPHENRAKLRVASDENQAASLRRVAHDENQAKALRTSHPTKIRQSCSAASLLMSIAAASPRCSARYENRVPPRPITQNHTTKRAYRQERYTGNDTYGFSAQTSPPWAEKESPSGKNALEKQTAESKRLRSRKKTEVYIFILPHQNRKSNGTECKYAICLHSRPS